MPVSINVAAVTRAELALGGVAGVAGILASAGDVSGVPLVRLVVRLAIRDRVMATLLDLLLLRDVVRVGILEIMMHVEFAYSHSPLALVVIHRILALFAVGNLVRPGHALHDLLFLLLFALGATASIGHAIGGCRVTRLFCHC